MNYGNIKECDIADGPGVRVSLFVSGCRHHCKGCFNKETWDFGYGKPYTKETEDEIIRLLAPSYIQGLTLLGGEPFEPENQEELQGCLKECGKPTLTRIYGATQAICMTWTCPKGARCTRK